MTLPHSDACFVAAYPAARMEAWLDGHNRAFAFFGGVPQSILYDNDKCLVSRILPDGTRRRTRAFSGLQSHYLFEDRYGRPGKGNDKGKVEGLVGYARRNFMVPLPQFESWDAFNVHLEVQCQSALNFDGLKEVFVLPAGDAALLARGAAILDDASLAGSGPVAAQGQSLFLICEVVDQALSGRTDVGILLLHIAKVLFAKSAPGLDA